MVILVRAPAARQRITISPVGAPTIALNGGPTAVIAALIIAVTTPVLASVSLPICNEGTIPVSVGLAYKAPSAGWAMPGPWFLRGWYRIRPGECKSLDHRGFEVPYFFAFAIRSPQGQLGSYQVDLPSWSQDWREADRVFCVDAENAFDFSVESLRDVQGSCKNGFSPVPFSVFIDPDRSDRNSTYQLTLTPTEDSSLKPIEIAGRSEPQSSGPTAAEQRRSHVLSSPVPETGQLLALMYSSQKRTIFAIREKNRNDALARLLVTCVRAGSSGDGCSLEDHLHAVAQGGCIAGAATDAGRLVHVHERAQPNRSEEVNLNRAKDRAIALCSRQNGGRPCSLEAAICAR